MSEEIESRVTKKLSPDFSRTERQIITALSKLDDFFSESTSPAQSGTVSELPGNSDTVNQEPNPNEDRSQNDPRPVVGSSIYVAPIYEFRTLMRHPTTLSKA